MDNTVVIRIPKTKNYTLYAEGSLCRIDKDGEDHLITLDFSHPVILYYTFRYHRRLYVITSPGTPVLRNDDVSGNFSIIAQLRGRSFDRFKRSMQYIVEKTEKRCYEFPAAFFWQLSYLAQAGKNDRINLGILIKKYTAQAVFLRTVKKTPVF